MFHDLNVRLIFLTRCHSRRSYYSRQIFACTLRHSSIYVFCSGKSWRLCIDVFRRSAAVVDNRYGSGTGQIWLDNLQCLGNESSLVECSHGGWGVHNCVHSQDVSIACNGNSTGKCNSNLLQRQPNILLLKDNINVKKLLSL